jgi:hypothetical protein
MMLVRTAHNRLAALADNRFGIGNNPPGPIDFANESIAALSDWMKDHPVVESEDDARAPSCWPIAPSAHSTPWRTSATSWYAPKRRGRRDQWPLPADSDRS